MYALLADHDSRTVLVPHHMNTFVAAGIVYPDTPVLRTLNTIGGTQIITTIIQRVVVAVIPLALIAALKTKYLAMHTNGVLFAVFTPLIASCIKAASTF